MAMILLLEDDPLLGVTVEDLLKAEGFEVDWTKDGDEALSLSFAKRYDLYLLDINVPYIGGIDLLRSLRESGDQTPAIFISALRDIGTITQAFDCACDDYIKKPFELDELLVRIHAHLTKHNPIRHYGDFSYDLLSKRLLHASQEVDLGAVEREIFDLLVRNQGQLIYKDQFFEVMERPTDLALRVHIAKLKKRFGLHVSNVKGVGYRLEKL